MMLGRATSGLPSSLLSREQACEGCGASGSRSDQCSSTVRFSVVTAQTAGAKSGPPVLHPRPLRAVVTQFRSSAPACDKANFQKSGIRSRTGVARRAEGPAHAEYDRKSCDRNKTGRRGLWWTERVGVPSFGTVHLPRIDPCDGSSASAGSHLPKKKRRHKNARRPQRHPWRSQARRRNDGVSSFPLTTPPARPMLWPSQRFNGDRSDLASRARRGARLRGRVAR